MTKPNIKNNKRKPILDLSHLEALKFLFSMHLKQAITSLSDIAQKCDFLVGHNAVEFDRKYLGKACKKYSIKFPQKYWIDTMTDIPYSNSIKTRKLDYLAVEHNISVVVAHRAIFDI